MLLIFSDFRKVKGGWEMPYKTEVYMGSELMYTSLVVLEINKGLSNDLFDPNKVEVKGSNMQEMIKKMMQQEK